jgi:Holliday junction resolvase
MSRSQREKGARFEREVVADMNDHGLDAERNLSQSRDGGYDIDSLAGAFECKARARLPAYLQPNENVRAVVFTQDRGERLALIRWADLVKLFEIERRSHDGA